MDSALFTQKSFPVLISQDLAWGDMDAFAHVNNTSYLRYFESARIACFDRIFILDVMRDSGVGPILAETTCRFLVPLTYPDKLTIGARISEVGNTSFKMENAVWSKKDGLAATGQSRLVMVDYKSGSKVRLPDHIRASIKKLDQLS